MSSVVEGGPARSWRRLFLVGAGGLAVAAATVLPAAAGGLGATAAGAAVAEPVMYVGNPGSSSILGFHLPATGDVAPAVTVSSPGDLAPSQLAFSAGGDLWSANGVQGTNKTLTAFTPAQLAAGGTATPAVTITTPGAPYGLAFDGQGDLWATEQTAHELVEYAPGQLTASGAPAPVLVISNDASTSLKDPRALAFDAGGDLWVTTTNGGPGHVVEYTPAQLAAGGAPTPAVTLTSLGDNPGGLAFDTAGDLWVTVFTGVPGPTVLGFAPAQLAASGSPVPEKKFTTHTSWGLAFDPSGNLWVVEPTTKKVDEYSSAQLAAGSPGTPAATLGGATTTLDQPFGVAVAAPPTLTSVTPDPAKPGSTVTLHGTGFTSATTVSFSGVPGTTVVDVSPFTLTAVVPPGTGSATLGVSTWAGTSNAVSFSFATPGLGYYEVAKDGGLFAYTAPFKGSMGAKHLNAPVVGMVGAAG
ncbi:MAG: IPT/TIG domain-containing protein [Acidimicrobiales bacterium]